MNRGTKLGYGSAKWTKGAQKFSVFTNILDGDANALLSVGLDGRPILFTFNTKTFDAEYGNVMTFGTRNVVSFGGNIRYNSFDLSLAPRGDTQEGGGYIQDEISSTTTCGGWWARVSTASACSTSRTSRPAPRSSSSRPPTTRCASRSTAPSVRPRSSTTSSTSTSSTSSICAP